MAAAGQALAAPGITSKLRYSLVLFLRQSAAECSPQNLLILALDAGKSFGGRALPGPAWELTALPQIPCLDLGELEGKGQEVERERGVSP